MSYDLHGSWDPRTGHHAGLRKLTGEEGLDATLNVVRVFLSYLSQLVIIYEVYNVECAVCQNKINSSD